jgi:4-deoxy-L-threo-5-hexosulose-uronate ketol-isomerase
VLNIGGPGTVTVDGVGTPARAGQLYVGRGSKAITFASDSVQTPARYYLLSFPAHAAHPTVRIRQSEAEAVRLGSSEAANQRTIYKLIHPGGARSCQLVMGFTVLEPGSVWNTMPPHTHERRMEVYLYFDVPEDARVFHFMGVERLGTWWSPTAGRDLPGWSIPPVRARRPTVSAGAWAARTRPSTTWTPRLDRLR